MNFEKFIRLGRMILLRWTHGGPRAPHSTPDFGWKNIIVGVAASMFFIALSAAAQGEQIFKGEICLGPEGRTPEVVNGESRLPCTVKHPKKGARYILFNAENKTTYHLDGRAKPKPYAGLDVIVLGTLDNATGTIYADDIYRSLPSKVTNASTVYLVCDACPRGMAAAWQTAFESLQEWGRFDITPDPKKADLVIIFSANPYLGDYITRDGPDKRPVNVEITYMNLVDPQTGQNLWGDSRQWGSLFVARATRDLIKEFKQRMEEETATHPQPPPNKHRKNAQPAGS